MNYSSIGMRPAVTAARQRWAEGREEIRKLHNGGAPGRVVCHRMSDLLDAVLIDIYNAALQDYSDKLATRVSLVLLGGCGRRDIAPWSDVDLMTLYQGTLTDEVVEFSRRISQDVTDSGMHLGYSLRTPREACSMALQDAYVLSSLTEARYLCGNEPLVKKFKQRFKRIVGRRATSMIRGILAARQEERVEFGETVYLLRPNIKKSRGALRDVHLIRWLGFVRHGVTDLQQLLDRGGISTADTKQLNESTEFLLRVRNEMHFHADKAEDLLGRNEQVRLAELFVYSGSDALLSVETFMRDYFRYTSRISYICNHFVSKMVARKRGPASTVLQPLLAQQIDDHYVIGPMEIGVRPSSIDDVKSDLERVLHLMQLASLHGKDLEHDTWIAIRHEMLKNPEVAFTRECAQRFMALLSGTARLAGLLRRLHEMLVLEKIIPGFQHVRGLLQFNEYHKYTVDEHSLRAVAAALGFQDQNSQVGHVYRKIKRKNILHLTLLLHDLGKGFEEDHSEVGRRIAEETGKRFGLSDDDTADIMFLVHNHLVMSHLALHRDINDMSLVAEFASNLGSMEMLSMLYVLTCADITAVGPGVLTPWKQGLLDDLFVNARSVLTGKKGQAAKLRLASFYNEVAEQAENEPTSKWLKEKVTGLPNNYCTTHSPEIVSAQLLLMQGMTSESVFCWVNPVQNTRLHEVCVGKKLRPRSGNFYKLTGLLMSMGLRIQSADIKMIDDEILWYWFQFEDSENQNPSTARLQEIRQRSLDLINGVEDGPPKFRKVWGAETDESRAAQLSRPKIQVRINNETANNATIVDVFAYDKLGLLYRITKKIYKLGLDLRFARVATYGHQVIDVFYVTDADGNKIRNLNQIQIIKQELYDTVTDFLASEDES
jgi:[protein-PII] uridylyltransferase